MPAPDRLGPAAARGSGRGAVLADPPGVFEQPELAAAAVARLVEDDALRERRGLEARAYAEAQSFAAVAKDLDEIYQRPRRPPARTQA